MKKRKTSEELIATFKRENKLTGARWKRFCNRYASRDTSTIVSYIRQCYKGEQRVPSTLSESLKKELSSSSVAANASPSSK